MDFIENSGVTMPDKTLKLPKYLFVEKINELICSPGG
jgi:hypothetical protein